MSSCKASRRRNLEYHEEEQKDVALIHVAHPPKNAEKEQKLFDE
jgi:hypothetical protein